MSIVSTAISSALAPFTHYIYAGIIALILAGFIGYTYHERHVQHEKDVAAALTEIKVVAKKDILIEHTADATVAKAEIKYVQVTSAPPVADLGLVCRDAGGGSIPDSAADHKSGAVQGQPVPADVYDPSGQLLTDARSYEATIGELQETTAALRKLIADADAAHNKVKR